MALTIATGFVVDDAIVVIETFPAISKRRKPLAAALKGAGEIGFTIISLTFSLIAVLIPCCLWAISSGDCSANLLLPSSRDFDLSGVPLTPDTDDVRADAQP